MSNYHDIPKPDTDSRGNRFSAYHRKLASVINLWRPKNAPDEEVGISTLSRVAMRLTSRNGTAYTPEELMDGASVTNASVNTAIASAPAATRAALGNSHVVTPEILPSSILFHDSGYGNAQILANGNTRTVEPGPGTLTASVNGSSIVRYTGRGRGIISNIAGTGAQSTIVHAGAHTVAAGLTVMAKVISQAGSGMETSAAKVGFSSSTTAPDWKRGEVSIYQSTNNNYPSIQSSRLDSSSDVSAYEICFGVVKPGQEVAIAVHYKTTAHQQYYMQAPAFEGFGCGVGGEGWVLINETFADLSGLTVYPFVGTQFAGTIQYRDFMVLDSWTPSYRHQTFDLNRTDIGTHIPTLAKDPVSGLVIAAWNRGQDHVGQGMSAIRAAVRKPTGEWTTVQEIMAAPTAPEGVSICNISQVGNVLKLVYWRDADGDVVEGGVFYWRTLTIHPTTGVITLGTESQMGIAATNNLNFSPIITLPSGRLVMPFHQGPDINFFLAWSDDDGATWSQQKIHSDNCFETTLVIESDGALGAYHRAAGNSAKYNRCADPESAITTWAATKTLKTIPQPGGSGSRMQAIRHTGGKILLVGYDHKTTRRKITIWEMGDEAALLGKTFVGDFAPPEIVSGGIMQYPAILQDGDDFLLAFSRQLNGGVSLNIGIQLDTLRWVDPIAVHAGGTGRRNALPDLMPERIPTAIILPYTTTPTPNCNLGTSFYLTLTASTATLQAPTAPLPWQEITIVIQQGGSGSYTAAFDAIYQFNGITPTWRTAVGEANVLKAIYNELTNKWVVTSWN